MKKLVYAILCILLVFSAGCTKTNGSSQQSDESAPQSTESVQQSDAVESESSEPVQQSDEAASQSVGKVHVAIDVKDYGTITVELDGDNAPISVSNFVSLVKEGFYDGLTFHRIMTGFMIQGGDPEGTGTGGSDKTI